MFLDLTDQIACCGEQGLLSIAFAPDYEKSGLLYASFTNTEGDSRIVEYQSEDGEPVEAADGRELLAIDQPYSNHNGGLVLFGPDGELYAGYGDGGSAGDPERNAQDPSSPLGKLLRVDPSGGDRYLVVARGLRNPWRFSFDRETDDLWIGDVGQQEFEEIDGGPIAVAGGRAAQLRLVGLRGRRPLQRRPGGARSHPAGLRLRPRRGLLDHGRLRGPRPARSRACTAATSTATTARASCGASPPSPAAKADDDTNLGVQVPGLSSFGEDADGHVYATSVEGPVYRLEPSE